MTEEVRRINNFLSFLKTTWRTFLWAGVSFGLIGILLYVVSWSREFYVLGIGFLILGIFMTIRSIAGTAFLLLPEEYLIRETFSGEIQKLKRNITLLSVLLVLGIVGCIIIIFTHQWRFLIASLVPIILYLALEYIINAVIVFRMKILENEIFKNQE